MGGPNALWRTRPKFWVTMAHLAKPVFVNCVHWRRSTFSIRNSSDNIPCQPPEIIITISTISITTTAITTNTICTGVHHKASPTKHTIYK